MEAWRIDLPHLPYGVPEAPDSSRPTVLLRHDLPDGTWHVDWLLARDSGGEAALIAFRLPARLDEIAPESPIQAERIADHRPLYLEYEGPISGDRGTVTRLARGRIRSGATDGCAWDLSVEWEREGAALRRQRVSVRNRDEEWWHVAVVAATDMVESPPSEKSGRTPRKET